MSLVALIRGVDGVLVLCCAFIVAQAQLASPLVQTPADWQLKMALFILLMEAFVAAFMILALERLRQSSESSGKHGVITVCGIISQVISMGIVLPCLRTIFWYSHLGRSLARYSYVTHVTLPMLVCIVEISLSIVCVLQYLHSYARELRESREEYKEEHQSLHGTDTKTPPAGEYMTV